MCVLQRLLPDTAHVGYRLDGNADEPLQKPYRAITPDDVRNNLTNPNEKPLHEWGQPPVSETAVSRNPTPAG